MSALAFQDKKASLDANALVATEPTAYGHSPAGANITILMRAPK
jgi:hypothetical protein